MRTCARLPTQFFYRSVKYACEISNALPSKNLLNKEGDPITAFFLTFKVKPRVGKFKVFGCLVTFRRYEPLLKEIISPRSNKNRELQEEKNGQFNLIVS
eukprot:4180252-Ditylum_brightwellii.AAC.1